MFCAQIIGVPITPDPTAAPVKAAVPLRRSRRVTPCDAVFKSVFADISVSLLNVED
jgi:hypothetical protein